MAKEDIQSLSADIPTAAASWMRPDFVPGQVSVVIPTYNRARHLSAALESVRNQSHRPIECLVVDDGSTDETAALMKEWEGSTAGGFEVRYLRQTNAGACAARNRGLRESTGEFINFLDSDDLLLPGAIEAKWKALAGSPALYSYDRGERVNRTGTVFGHFGKPWPAPGQPVIADYLFHTTAPLIRRALCARIGPWTETLKGCQEEEYFSRLRLMGGPGVFVDSIGHRVIEHAGPRIVGSEAHSNAVLQAYEMILARLNDAGPAYAADQAALRMELQTRYRLASERFAQQKEFDRSFASLARARHHGYTERHVLLALGLGRFLPHGWLVPAYYAMRKAGRRWKRSPAIDSPKTDGGTS